MPEVIHNYKAPIAVIPVQSLLAAEVHQLQIKIRRARKKEVKELLEKELALAERKLAEVLKSLGRQ